MTQDRASAPTPERVGALRGLHVIDFGHYIAGPLAGMLLADQGAEVIKGYALSTSALSRQGRLAGGLWRSLGGCH